MAPSNSNPNDTFWLARYAHNQLAPLFTLVKNAEPSLEFSIEVTFADENSKFSKEPHISISSHWSREGMFQHSTWLRTRRDVDEFVLKVAADVAALGLAVTA